MTSIPSTEALMVAAPITLLIPGAGPPPTSIANFLGAIDILSVPINYGNE